MDAKIKAMGHPIHPMLIAYPVAFYTATLVGFSIYGRTADPFWLRLTIAMNAAGVVMALVAALPGLLDWMFGIPRRTRAKTTGLLHGLANVVALGLFAVTLFSYADQWTTQTGEGAMLGIVLSAAGVGVTILAGFLGWILVQTHHVGVRLTREQERVDMEQERQPLRRAV